MDAMRYHCPLHGQIEPLAVFTRVKLCPVCLGDRLAADIGELRASDNAHPPPLEPAMAARLPTIAEGGRSDTWPYAGPAGAARAMSELLGRAGRFLRRRRLP